MLFIFVLRICTPILYTYFCDLLVCLTLWLGSLSMVVSIDLPHFNGYVVVYGITGP